MGVIGIYCIGGMMVGYVVTGREMLSQLNPNHPNYEQFYVGCLIAMIVMPIVVLLMGIRAWRDMRRELDA